MDPFQISLEKAGRIAEEAANVVQAQGLPVGEVAVKLGIPADEILNYAEEREVDLIVMGPRDFSTLQRLVLGSIWHGVVSRARVPVLVVR